MNKISLKHIVILFILAGIAFSASIFFSHVFRTSDSLHTVFVRLGGHDLYIPREYLRFGHTGFDHETVLLQAWYPGAIPVPGKGDNSAELWQQGTWWKNVRVLITSSSRRSSRSNDRILSSVRHLHATKIVGMEYGLLRKTQPDEKVQDHYDVWFEMDGETILSYITCSDKLISSDVPQCVHWVWLVPDVDGYVVSAKIHYDRRFLPEWKMIRDNVYMLFKSFSDPNAAREFSLQQLKGQPGRI